MFDLNTLLLVGATVGTALFGAATFWAGRITAGNAKADAAIKAADGATKSAADAHKRIDEQVKLLADFKEHVAQSYVPNADVVRLEQKITDEFRRVQERLDGLFEQRRQGA